MRRSSRIACLLLCGACSSPAKAPPAEARAIGRVPEPQPLAQREFAIDVERYSIEIELLPQERALRATARVRFLSREAGLASVELDLDGLAVQRVRDADGRELGFRQQAGKLRIDLARALATGEACEIAIDYSGKPRRGLWFVAERDGRPTQVFTQGACDEARGWFPCIDHPAERASSEIVVRLPRAWRAICAGERVERREEGEFALERWRLDFPHPAYLETLCAGEFAVRSASFDGLPLEYYAAPELEPLLEPSFDETEAVLSCLSRLTGRRYPYAKYAQVCVAEFPFGGMENISATTLTENALVDERGQRDAGMGGLVAHEAAHQWFGDLVSCADWSDAWLNEGLATYFGALYTAEAQGPDAFALALSDMQEADAATDSGRARRAVVWDRCVDAIDLFSGRIYGGAAVRLELLRTQLGDGPFFAGIRNYLAENAGKSVRTRELQSAFERASGRDLARFFEQWFRAPGHPEFAVTWKWDEERKQLVLSVDQRQRVEDGTPAAFEAQAELEIKLGAETRLERLELRARKQLFQFDCPEQPRWVRFDPQGRIPKSLEEPRSDREWLDLSLQAAQAPARRRALRELARLQKEGSKSVPREELVAALVARATEETVARVRAQALTALAGATEPTALAVLALAAEQDPDACARVAALEALCAVPPDPERAGLAGRVFAAGYSWNTMGAALRLHVHADPDGARAALEHACELDSPHGTLAAQALPLLAELDAPRARALALSLAADRSRPAPLRGAAAAALARLSARDNEAAAALEALLADPAWVVRRSAIAALAQRADAPARKALASRWQAATLPQERRAIEAVFREAGAAQSGSAAHSAAAR